MCKCCLMLKREMALDGLLIEVQKFLKYKQVHIPSKEFKPCVLEYLVCIFFMVFSIYDSRQSYRLSPAN